MCIGDYSAFFCYMMLIAMFFARFQDNEVMIRILMGYVRQ